MVRAFFVTAAFLLSGTGHADDPYVRREDLIYGRKFGVALTMDAFTPKAKPNGAAVVVMISGGWYSSHDSINSGFVGEFLTRGYTVFCVVHGSQPKFSIPEVVEDVNRSVRFIRSKAKEFSIDPNRLGVTGLSAGGHLSLMLGTAGTLGDPKAKDPVDRQSSRVQAVGCFFPPTDFLNYGKSGATALGDGTLKDFSAPFAFTSYNSKARRFDPVVDPTERKAIGKKISPAYFATADDPPTLIIHGDADKLVPIQQAELMIDHLKKAGVETKLVVRKNASHGWVTILDDMKIVADWFDLHLKTPKAK